MKRFKVGLWWNTDLRCDWEGEATSEIDAIFRAMHHHRISEWTQNGPGFRLTIELAR